MKHIFFNTKRFDVKKELGGVNNIAEAKTWGEEMSKGIEAVASKFENLDFAMFVPEGHIINASKHNNKLAVGCQGVFRRDVEAGKNFGAFTTLQTGKSANGLGATYALIGHCEERNNLREIIELGGGEDFTAIDKILNEEIKCALAAGMKVCYCVGERFEEMDKREEVLSSQIKLGLNEIDNSQIVVAYEPVWAIGPGRPVPTADYIDDVAKIIKNLATVDVIYGGGLKTENAEMIASIKSIDGGLIALTSFGADFGFSFEKFGEIVETYNKAL